MIELLDGVYRDRECCRLHTMISVMLSVVLEWSLHTGVVVARVLAHPITSVCQWCTYLRGVYPRTIRSTRIIRNTSTVLARIAHP